MSILDDKELNQYRNLVQPATTFEEGFGWKTVFGALFVGLVMLPASMYMTLAIGESGVGAAAQWVTVILFLEMAKRARSTLRPAEIFILFGMAGTLIGSPMESFFWKQFLVTSEAARSFGLTDLFPIWYAPNDPAVLDQRNFFSAPWVPALALMLFQQIIGRLNGLVLGYGLFRIVSDVEKLPFPMAPLGASGVTALTENQSGKEGWRWRCFCIGTAFGLAFGFLYAGIPTLTSTFLKEPFQLLPLPWLETSERTQHWFPACATGLTMDMGIFFLGMAIPFFGVLGAFIGMILTLIVNPFILYPLGMLPSWKPGMKTVEIMYANSIDFYLSFGIGMSLALAVIGILQCVRALRKKPEPSLDSLAVEMKVQPVKVNRGDIRPKFVLATYLISSALYITVCGWLLDWDFKGSHLFWVLLFFAFVYTPFVSYVTARLEGMAGMALDIPYIREAAFILSGYKGLNVWLLPVPISNYGYETVSYRTAELLGCSFRSIWKLAGLTVPLLFVLGLLYGQFIWSLGPIPSVAFPYAQQMWDLQARNQCLVLSSTVSSFSPFLAALDWRIILTGGMVGGGGYAALAALGLPVLFIYGLVPGLGQAIPQSIITQFAGALFGRYVMAPRFGTDRWRNFAPVLFAGYACGNGLIMMFSVGIRFLSASVFQLPY